MIVVRRMMFPSISSTASDKSDANTNRARMSSSTRFDGVSIHSRREREGSERHQLIIDAAGELAEAEGWDAVTTRKLADKVEYSQPVLYSHFDGKDAIVRAVAIQGCGELARQLRK